MTKGKAAPYAVAIYAVAAATLLTACERPHRWPDRQASGRWESLSVRDVRRIVAADGNANALSASGETPLMTAARYNDNPAVIQALIDAGAAIEVATLAEGHSTALRLAVMYNAPDVVRTLLDNGANPNAGPSPAEAYTSNGSLDTHEDEATRVVAAVAEGAALTRGDGRTTLMYAVAWNRPAETVALLLEAGAAIDVREIGGGTALTLAAQYNENPRVTALLLQWGAEVDAQEVSGQTALMYAVDGNRNPAIASALIEAGADLETRTRFGRTALMHAALYASTPSSVERLLDAGADAAARDDGGRTAWDYAQSNTALAGTTAMARLAQGRSR